MARFHVLPKSPLPVQFWLLGLDVHRGDLARRGFRRSPAPSGSRFYTLGPLTLHSAGLTLELAEGELHFLRRLCLFQLRERPISHQEGLDLSRLFLLEHEAWMIRHYGQEVREQQFRRYRLPPPVRRNLTLWRKELGAHQALSALLWTPTVDAERGPVQGPGQLGAVLI